MNFIDVEGNEIYTTQQFAEKLETLRKLGYDVTMQKESTYYVSLKKGSVVTLMITRYDSCVLATKEANIMERLTADLHDDTIVERDKNLVYIVKGEKPASTTVLNDVKNS